MLAVETASLGAASHEPPRKRSEFCRLCGIGGSPLGGSSLWGSTGALRLWFCHGFGSDLSCRHVRNGSVLNAAEKKLFHRPVVTKAAGEDGPKHGDSGDAPLEGGSSRQICSSNIMSFGFGAWGGPAGASPPCVRGQVRPSAPGGTLRGSSDSPRQLEVGDEAEEPTSCLAGT